ncbi:hypothetical protein H2198_009693 [Neophaeococcomyces mojaviensis]|uniref:Uncharacterized protein n=1 Tax=Neophaeococcomyces mojaviensis TaxID=3383035 RepID=A0ACC2ZTS0_9EURO|nr:hypothetical protein H2198_009693 [Knufia sp. JES_112]
MSSEVLHSFSGALQASLSVLLVIFYGVIASQFDLLDNASVKKVSHVSVKLFLPFLLITKIGSEVTLENAINYVPILIWAIVYSVVSLLIGQLAVKVFKLPPWVTPAIAFNNTTSLPLLLIQSMESTGILESILKDGESTSEAISRAQSYFLICSVVSNCMTFAVGPRLLDDDSSDSGDDDNEDLDQVTQRIKRNRQRRLGENGHTTQPDNNTDQHNDNEGQQENETTSLLPDRFHQIESQVFHNVHNTTHSILYQHNIHPSQLSSRTNTVLDIILSFLNAPLLGATIGLVIGLVPALHRAFFADSSSGGIFTAWLTASVRNTGDLFVSLQVIIVGVKLSSSLRKIKRGDDGDSAGYIPWSAAAFVFFMRYVFWPLVSVPLVFGLAKSGHLVGGNKDAVLWFAMMLMPTGPPAMSLIPMADVSGKDESIKMSMAKLLTAMYTLSPLLAVVVVGALKACKSAMNS